MHPRGLCQAALRVALLFTVAMAFVIAPGFAKPNATSAASEFTAGDAATVTTDRLNLRAVPGLSGTVLMVMPFGTALSILGGPKSADGYSWYRGSVQGADSDTGGPTGWVANDYISSNGWAEGTRVFVVDGPVNLRADASTRQARVASVPEGANLTIVAGPFRGEGYSWYQVTLQNGDSGFVAGEFLGTAAPGSSHGGIQAGDGVRVSDGPVNFRQSAGLTAKVLAVAPEGARFKGLEGPVSPNGYAWVKVFNYGFGQGWIATDFLSIDPNGFPGEEGA